MSKTPRWNEAQFLDLLQKVVSQTTNDLTLANSIYEGVTREMRLVNSLHSFEKFCAEESLPNVEPKTMADLQEQLGGNFGDKNVTVTPNEEAGTVAVEIALPDRTVTTQVKVRPPGEEPEDDVKVPFVPFPVTLPDDPELIWVLGRREDLAAEEGARALDKIQEEFWASKAGQKLLREHVERSFAEFIANVPAAALGESGLKRHYKEPETLHALVLGGAR